MQFKVTIHCGQVNTFQFEEAADKHVLFDVYTAMFEDFKKNDKLLRFGDLLINPSLITFVVIEEVQEIKELAPEEAVTLEA